MRLPASGRGAQLGTLRSWSNKKKYGFIEPNDGSKPIFVHRDIFVHNSFTVPPIGAQLRFVAGWDYSCNKPRVVMCRPAPASSGSLSDSAEATEDEHSECPATCPIHGSKD